MNWLSRAWQVVDGKKTYLTAALFAAKSIVVYSQNHDLVTLLDGLIAASAIVSGRSVLDKMMPKKEEPLPPDECKPVPGIKGDKNDGN